MLARYSEEIAAFGSFNTSSYNSFEYTKEDDIGTIKRIISTTLCHWSITQNVKKTDDIAYITYP